MSDENELDTATQPSGESTPASATTDVAPDPPPSSKRHTPARGTALSVLWWSEEREPVDEQDVSGARRTG